MIALADDHDDCLEKVSRRFDRDTVINWSVGKPLRYKIIFAVKMTRSQLA